jgi:hypothetical protein
MLNEASADSLITNPAHKPKTLAKTYVSELKAAKVKATVTRADSFMPRGWDYGVIVGLSATFKGEQSPVQITFSLNVAAASKESYRDNVPAEASGTVSIGPGIGQQIGIRRATDPDVVIKGLTSDIVAYANSQNESVLSSMVSVLEDLS